MASFTALTQNVYQNAEIPHKRIKLLISSIKNQDPDIFFLQEAASEQHALELNSHLNNHYYLQSSECTHIKYRAYSYISQP